MDALLEAKEAALKDPIGFVEKLQRGETLDLPGPQRLAEIPEDIDYAKYEVAAHHGNKPETRKKATVDGSLERNPQF